MQPLQGIRVVDLTRILSGPYCTMTLADLGAEVIKIESETGDDTRFWGPPFVNGESTYFLSVNRSKKSLVLDLKSDVGKEKLWSLIESADIVAENFRPGTLARLGFSWEEIHRRFPAIILVSLSGYGQTGPLASRPGYDLIAQGEGGLMGVTGEEGRPPAKVGFSIADIGTGMWGVIGVLAALRTREQTGQGDHVDVSLLETVLSWQTYLAEAALVAGEKPGPLGSAHPTIAPYQTFHASDGYFNLAVGNDSLWNRLCDLLDRVAEGERWYRDSKYARNPDRVKVRASLAEALNLIFGQRPRSEWLGWFNEAGIPAGSVNTIAESFESPQVQARGMVHYVEHPTVGRIPVVKIPIAFGSAETRIPTPPPVLGADAGAVFEETPEKKTN
ncbi:MAG TPA: CoA transferase [Ktedonobacteraceae bacterium]|nr:CoA transferase [Ktedonobacteraceae bacterium]